MPGEQSLSVFLRHTVCRGVFSGGSTGPADKESKGCGTKLAPKCCQPPKEKREASSEAEGEVLDARGADFVCIPPTYGMLTRSAAIVKEKLTEGFKAAEQSSLPNAAALPPRRREKGISMWRNEAPFHSVLLDL